LPGSGKSTLAEILSESQRWPVFSIDSYFTNPETGKYTFLFSENHIAYKKCTEQTGAAMDQQTEKIFVDNTFTLDWELEPYFKLAAKHNYTLFVVTVENYHGQPNVHGVSQEQLQKMAQKYKVKLM
jgi:hypothetical protein